MVIRGESNTTLSTSPSIDSKKQYAPILSPNQSPNKFAVNTTPMLLTYRVHHSTANHLKTRGFTREDSIRLRITRNR